MPLVAPAPRTAALVDRCDQLGHRDQIVSIARPRSVCHHPLAGITRVITLKLQGTAGPISPCISSAHRGLSAGGPPR